MGKGKLVKMNSKVNLTRREKGKMVFDLKMGEL